MILLVRYWSNWRTINIHIFAICNCGSILQIWLCLRLWKLEPWEATKVEGSSESSRSSSSVSIIIASFLDVILCFYLCLLVHLFFPKVLTTLPHLQVNLLLLPRSWMSFFVFLLFICISKMFSQLSLIFMCIFVIITWFCVTIVFFFVLCFFSKNFQGSPSKDMSNCRLPWTGLSSHIQFAKLKAINIISV